MKFFKSYKILLRWKYSYNYKYANFMSTRFNKLDLWSNRKQILELLTWQKLCIHVYTLPCTKKIYHLFVSGIRMENSLKNFCFHPNWNFNRFYYFFIINIAEQGSFWVLFIDFEVYTENCPIRNTYFWSMVYACTRNSYYKVTYIQKNYHGVDSHPFFSYYFD